MSFNYNRYPLMEFLVDGSDSREMAVDGATPKYFYLYGLENKIVSITGLRLVLRGKGLDIDSKDFFGFGYKTDALENGLQAQCKRKPGERNLLPPIQKIGDLLAYCDEVTRLDNFSEGKDLIAASVSFPVSVDLFDTEDWVRMAVRDDLTHLDSVQCFVVGSVEQDS